MYKSPIELLIRDVQHQIIERENEQVYRAAVQVVPNIDKDGLLRALAYDRGQYQMGYLDGLHDAAPRWIPVEERLPDNKEHDWVLAQVVEDNGFMHIPIVMEYRQQRNDWYEETYGWLSEHNGAFTVTHWMPLPEPPKGE